MGGCRCSYKSCKSATKTTENLHFFHYPVKHRERCATWIRNADKPQFLNLPDCQLRNKVVCGLHFEDKYFANIEKRRLVHNAVPTLDAGCDSLADDLGYAKEVEILPLGDGDTYILSSDHLQAGSSIKRHNGDILPDDAIKTEAEVFTIDPSYFGESFDVNREMVINKCEDSCDSDFVNNKMDMDDGVLIYDSRGRVKQDVDIDYEPTTNTQKVQNLFFDDDEEENIDSKALDSNEHTNASSASHFSNDSNDASLHATSSNGSAARSPSPLTVPVQQKTTFIKKVILKSNHTRFSDKAILNSLRDRVPPSLLGAVSLHLNKRRTTISEEEQSYAELISALAPSNKMIMQNEFGWLLPVKNDSETRKNYTYIRKL